MSDSLLIAAAETTDDVRKLAGALTEAWAGTLAVTICEPDDLDAGVLTSAAAILVLDAPPVTRRIASVFAETESLSGAMVVVGRGPAPPRLPHPDALGVGDDVEPARLVSLFAGLLHAQASLGRLRRELAVARRWHGGLHGEITRMHDELQLAAMVQREYLPRTLPVLHGVRFGALWRPAHYVSGDLYDVARLDHDHLGVFIADAVGHGVPAALMTMVIRRSLTMKVVRESSYTILEPADVLARLNRDLLRRQGTATRFATAAYAVVNCRERTVRLAGAGHPPPLHVKADGSHIELETEGALLGIFENERFDQIEFSLDVDDRLLLYSDGFEPAFPAPLQPGERRAASRYRDELSALAAERDPDRMVERLRGRLNDQLGSLHQEDDVTFVCMHAGPLEAAPAPGDPPTVSATPSEA